MDPNSRKLVAFSRALVCALALGGSMHHAMAAADQPTSSSSGGVRTPDPKAAVVRYQIKHVERAIAFYTEKLGFRLEQRTGILFASVSRGTLHLLLSGPGSSGITPAARRPPAGARWVESDRSLHRRSRFSHREAEDGGRPVPRPGRGRARRQADPDRGSRRQPDRAA